jgi:glycosyltransferase involved in cell wall biosynthesis
MRVLCAGPLPPTPTGIADYTADLLPHLAERVELSVAVGDDAPAPAVRYETLRASELSPRRLAAFDLCLLQIGNHRFHAWQLDLLARWPSVVVLHDAQLHHLYADVLLARGRGAAYLREVVYERPSAAASAVEAVAGERAPAWDQMALLGRVLDGALCTIAHSRFAASAALRARPRARVRLVHHGVAEPAADASPRGDEPFTIGTFGGLSAEKRVATVAAAFAQVRTRVPAARLLLVGEESPALPIARVLRQLGVEGATEVTGRVDLPTMEAAMRRCHACVQLRWPTAGEASGVVLRALRLGRPTIVSDHGWFAELPVDAAMRIPPGLDERDEAAALADALLALHSSPAQADQLSRGGLAYAAASSWPSAARRYEEILRETLATPDEPCGLFLAV